MKAIQLVSGFQNIIMAYSLLSIHGTHDTEDAQNRIAVRNYAGRLHLNRTLACCSFSRTCR
jgi:hypothetical protein